MLLALDRITIVIEILLRMGALTRILQLTKAAAVAGLIFCAGEYLLSVTILQGDWDTVFRTLDHPTLLVGVGLFVIPRLSVGVLLLALYALLRVNHGGGRGTAATAGIIFWGVLSFCYVISLMMSGQCQSADLLPITFWQLVEVLFSAVIGGWIYEHSVQLDKADRQ